MNTTQIHLLSENDLGQHLGLLQTMAPDLILAFGAVSFFETGRFAKELQAALPNTALVGCSTAGEIAEDKVYDQSCILTAIKFKHTHIKAVTTPITGMADSHDAGARLGRELPHQNLTAVFVLGTGVSINGSALVAGLESTLPRGINISGGLAADAGAFKQTWTLGPAGTCDDHVVAVGFYGEHIRLSYGTFAGWEPFGPARKVTRSEGNMLYELDGKRALDVYKRYLGDYAKDLPGSGLLFPFAMLNQEHEKHGIFRTILAVDETTGSLTLAGDMIPAGT